MKKFLIIGNSNAITYKETFSFIKDGKLWLGNNWVKQFVQPNGEIKKFGNICWFTNLEAKKAEDAPTLINTYNEEDYPKYDNYDAINVNKLIDIPYDYNGVMGVPITITDKVCSDGLIHFDIPTNENPDVKYKIIGLLADKRDKNPIFIKGRKTYLDEGHKNYVGGIINGRATYARVIIQKVCSDGLIHFDVPTSENSDVKYKIKGIDRYVEDNPNYGHRFKINGKEIYARILIQKVQ